MNIFGHNLTRQEFQVGRRSAKQTRSEDALGALGVRIVAASPFPPMQFQEGQDFHLRLDSN